MADYLKAVDYALKRLENDVPQKLTYHSIAHTRDDVVVACQLYADRINLPDSDRLLLLTAAWYHDLGFIHQVKDHEEISVEIARANLPLFGYTPYQINIVSDLIMATKMPQQPHTDLEKLLADADMDSLGREDFFDVCVRLRDEIQHYGMIFSEFEWWDFELKFLLNHTYFTQVAAELRNAQKQKNLAELRRRVQLYAS
ncbi:MAG: phosphohydrolase [Phototrophicales bacterium]|nr:MAG: phosphohydrolase [Phototrophicales bacterium]RMG70481.1 MAG: HD domain-containing protein [Chloroflexota bacterium]